MGKSMPAPPTPVDPTALAAAQASANQGTAQLQSRLNNANSYTPYGSVTQTQNPDTQQWTSTTTLSPQEQGLFDQSMQAQGSALGVANQQIGRVGQALGQGLTPGNIQGQINAPDSQQAVNDATHAAFNSSMNLLQPQMQQNAEHQQAQLVAQGLNPNDAAYQNSQTLFDNSQNELKSQAANAAVQTGQQEQNTLFGQAAQRGNFANQAAGQLFNQQAAAQSQPINEFAALMGQGQVQSPQGTGFNATGVAPTDVTGAYALSQQQQNANYQSALQQQQSSLSGLMSLGQAGMMAFSDVRLKEDVRRVGTHASGLPLYSFRYVWDRQAHHVGVMAQEALQVRPDVVGLHPSGFLMVDYGKLGR